MTEYGNIVIISLMINSMKIKSWITQTLKAMRLFSLTLAFGATSTGIIAAWRKGFIDLQNLQDILLIILITLAGLAVQCGANLINDFFEGSFKYRQPGTKNMIFIGRTRSYFDVYIFLLGLAMLGFSALIGIYLVWISGWKMLVIGLIGVIGSYAYTGEPFVYKRKGLGVPLSFILMGPLMTLGAWFPFSQKLSWYPVLLGLPLSLLVPAMMISNEMRDFYRDEKISMGTLSTRIGSRWSKGIYIFCISFMFLITGLYIITGIFPVPSLIAVILLPSAVLAWKSIRNHEGLGIPRTNRLHLNYMVLSLGWLIFF